MNARDAALVEPAAGDVHDRVAAVDWTAVGADLDARGAAVIERLLTADECERMAALYPRDDLFRSTVTMARHGFGRGEYHYFGYPLPPLTADSGTRSIPAWRRSRTDGTRRWGSRRGSRIGSPTSSSAATRQASAARRRCCCSYGAGDYNCLHQDLYGEHVFPLQVVVLLSEPGRDFSGGEFVMTEQRPRMQSRPLVVPLTRATPR